MNRLLLTTVLTLILVTPIVLALLNIDFGITLPKKSFYPNETIPINISIINREVTYLAKNLSLELKVGQKSYLFELGDLSVGQSVTKSITLPEQAPGTYIIRGILNYTGYFGERNALETYNSFDVKFPEIKRLPRNIYIKSFDIPENVTAGKPYEVSVTVVNNGTVDGDLIIKVESLDANVSKTAYLKSGDTTIANMNVTSITSGILLVEAKVYAIVDNIKYLLNYVGKNVYVKEAKAAKIEFDRMEFADEPDNEINQNDVVKLKLYVRNKGDSAAASVKGILTSSYDKIKITSSSVNYVWVSVNESIAPDYFEIETADATTGTYNLKLDVSFVDFLGTHTVTFLIPIEVKQDVIPPCASNADCETDEICQKNKCEKIVCICGEIKNHKCIEYDCCSNSDCPTNSVCDLSSHSCIQCLDKYCCPTGKIWCEQKSECLKPIECVGCPKDTPCKNFWPYHEGETFWINEKLNACDMFEVCHPDLQYIAKEAAECCESGCKNANCHRYCSKAYEYSDLASGLTIDRFKKCAGLYLIYGLGPAAKYMQEYYSPEIECSYSGYDEKINCGSYKSTTYSQNAQKLKCQPPVGQPKGWASDTDMTKNSCLFSDLPAHVNIKILSTGTCVDYSISLTTLLRMVGYTTNEVYSLNGPRHEFNLVKFPGEIKWNLVDTVGNSPSPYNPTDVPSKWYPYCKYNIDSCANDAGEVACPTKNMVKGCS